MKKTESPNDEGPIIVALGPGEEGAALIEAAEAIAQSEGRALECLTIDDGGIMPGATIARLAENRDLARSLGAVVSVLPGIDVTRGLLEYARSRAASTIVVGRSGSGKKRYGIATRLLEAKRRFSVIEIGRPGQNSIKQERARYFPSDESSMHYFAAFLMVAGMTLLNLGLASYAGYWAAAILYLAAISLGAIWLEPIPILFAALLSAIAWDFLFIPPRFTLTISRPEDVFMLALYLLVSLCSGLMTSRLRASERLLREQRMKLDRINSLALSLVGTASNSEILARGVESIEEATKCEVIAILRADENKLRSEAESGWEPLDGNARSAAALCFEEGKIAGRFTDILPASEWHFLPLESPKGRLGVIGLRPAHDADWDETMESYVRTSVSTVAMALSR